MTKLTETGGLLATRFRVEGDTPADFTQLLDKLIDTPEPCATPVLRIPRKATEVANEIRQTDQSRRCA